MKTFGGNRALDNILAACWARGWRVDTYLHDQHGSDYVAFWPEFEGESLGIWFNSVTGEFIGRRNDGRSFSNRSAHLDNEPWFAALLNFVYLPLPVAGVS